MAPTPRSWLIRGLSLIALAAAVLAAWHLLQGPEVEVDDRALDDASRTAVISTPASSGRIAAEREVLDPLGDGWESEEFAGRAEGGLRSIVELLENADGIDVSTLAEGLSADFSCEPLRPLQLATVFDDGSVEVRRRRDGSSEEELHRGAQGLAMALRALAEPLQGASAIATHVKVVRVAVTPSSAATRVDIEVAGRTAGGTLQQSAIWDCRWTRTGGEMPQLASIRVEDFEEVAGMAPGAKWFSDCTEAVLGENPSYREQLVYGLNHWLSRIESLYRMHTFVRNGIAVGDVNSDGLDDVYVCQPGGLPNRLYVQKPDGTASDHSRRAGVDCLEHTASALLVDLDNDGDQDLVLATELGLVVMENDASGRFRGRLSLPTERDVHSLSAADYDSDGDLDLYISIDLGDRELHGERPRFVYHDANDGGANRLFQNNISRDAPYEWRFSDVTEAVGLEKHNRRHSLAAAWEDYDGDGDPDLYVANDYGQNCLYQNDGGRFVDVAAEAGVVDFGSGMSVSWADFNRDGRMDLYVGNMFSSAGSRITRQGQFKTEEGAGLRAVYQRFAKGNSLFQNTGGGKFREVGRDAAVEVARWAWSSVFVDVNNDGWEDLFVANGYITNENTDDL